MNYLAQCIPGLQGVAWNDLSRQASVRRLLAKEDGLLVFEASGPPKHFRNIKYLNNVFLVLGQLLHAPSAAAALEDFSRRSDWHQELQKSVTPKHRTFRIMVQEEGRLVGADRAVLDRMHAMVGRLTHLKHAPRGGGAEFWMIYRQSGRAFLCKRLSKRARTEKDLLKGELRPELAHLLCLLSEPQAEDIFLDPFAGTGAIPLARTYYPYNMIFAFDSEPAKVRLMRSRVKKGKDLWVRKGSPVIAGEEDVRNLERLDEGFIHKVVTDPPWGEYDISLADRLPTLYRETLSELCRVVRPEGLLVLLFGDADLANRLSREFDDRLLLLETHRILVSGKKAVVYKWRRR